MEILIIGFNIVIDHSTDAEAVGPLKRLLNVMFKKEAHFQDVESKESDSLPTGKKPTSFEFEEWLPNLENCFPT